MTMKRCAALALALILALLAGCAPGAGAPTGSAPATPTDTASAAPADAAKSPTLKATIKNSSGYIFQELYIMPTASSEWGQDHLGSTDMLKKGGAYDVLIPTYDFNTYNIRIVDEDDDVYLFEKVPLGDGCTVTISWEDDLEAIVEYSGNEAAVTVSGEMVFEDEITRSSPASEWIEMVFNNGTEWDFEEIYVFRSGVTDQDEMGYNHIAAQSFLADESCDIGVHLFDEYSIRLIDEDQDTWSFDEILLEDGCNVAITFENNGAHLYVEYADGSTSYTAGEIS